MLRKLERKIGRVKFVWDRSRCYSFLLFLALFSLLNESTKMFGVYMNYSKLHAEFKCTFASIVSTVVVVVLFFPSLL